MLTQLGIRGSQIPKLSGLKLSITSLASCVDAPFVTSNCFVKLTQARVGCTKVSPIRTLCVFIVVSLGDRQSPLMTLYCPFDLANFCVCQTKIAQICTLTPHISKLSRYQKRTFEIFDRFVMFPQIHVCNAKVTNATALSAKITNLHCHV